MFTRYPREFLIDLMVQSSNFDFPPATTPFTLSTTSNQDLYLEDFGPNRIQSAPSSAMEERGSSGQNNSRRAWSRESAIRDEIRRRHASTTSYVSGIFAPHGPIVLTSAMRSRPQVSPRLDLPRHRRQHEELNPSIRGGRLQRVVDRLNEASSSLHPLLDHHALRLDPSDINTREYSGEAEVNRRRAKRRKLDGDPLSSSFKGFSYGYHGQVVPGKLKMEIFSCDGGLYVDPARHGINYCSENVLRNDKSVYCTDSNNCNIIMCHQGKTNFSLDKLVIKAPERGFTAP